MLALLLAALALPSALAAPLSWEEIPSSTGAPLTLFHYDTGPDPKAVLYFISGSGCVSLDYYLPAYFKHVQTPIRVYALQKEGVRPHANGLLCARRFTAHYTHDDMLARNREALAAVLARHPEGIDGVFGLSEGGLFAAELAAGEPRVRRVAVMGAGGMSFRGELETLARRTGEADALSRTLARVAARPDSLCAREDGLSHRYWTSFLDVDPLPSFLSLSQPVLVVFGEQDDVVPVESGYLLRERFAAAGRADLQLLVVPGAGHTLWKGREDLKVSYMPQIAAFLVEGQPPAPPAPAPER